MKDGIGSSTEQFKLLHVKMQCKMVLIKDGFWGIINGTETAPFEGEEKAQAKFATRHDKALVTIVLAIEPSLLYLIGNDLTDPVIRLGPTNWSSSGSCFR